MNDPIYFIKLVFHIKLLMPTHKGADRKSCTEKDRIFLFNDILNTVLFWGKRNAILMRDIVWMILIGEN